MTGPLAHVHVARDGGVTYARVAADVRFLPREPQDFLFDPPPAQPKTEDLPVTGREEPVLCCMDDGRRAVCKAYYAELGNSARLLPWCRSCIADIAWKVVASGFPLTLLPMEPLPTYDEVKRQLDAFQRADQDVSRLVRQTGPRPNRGRSWM